MQLCFSHKQNAGLPTLSLQAITALELLLVVHYYSYVFCSRKDQSCGQCLFSDGIDLSFKNIRETEKPLNLQECLVTHSLQLVRVYSCPVFEDLSAVVQNS